MTQDKFNIILLQAVLTEIRMFSDKWRLKLTAYQSAVLTNLIYTQVLRTGETLDKKMVERFLGQAMAEERTKVIFRKWRKQDGRVLALFPEIQADIQGHHCKSYEHKGQYGAADYHLCIGRTTPASPGEFADLKAELEKIGYQLDVVDRITPAMVEARKRALARETTT
ncbi:MAG: hypothetical protein ACOZFS_04505 [Thermodesulfobacteriota bacterium]